MKRLPPIVVYVATLVVLAASVILAILLRSEVGEGPLIAAVTLAAIFGFSEALDLNFYEEGSRFGLSASEAIFLPMVFVLPFHLVVLGITVAMALGRELLRITSIKGLFNVAQYTIASAAAASAWIFLADGRAFTLRNIGAAIVSVGTFAFLTHVFTSAAISISEGHRFLRFMTTTVVPTLISLVGSVILGLLFVAAYLTSPFSIALFPPAIAVLFAGYRATVRQRGERAKAEALLSASRVLAAGRDLDEALVGFLREVQNVTSAAQAGVVLRDSEDLRWSSVRGGEIRAKQEPLPRTSPIAKIGDLVSTREKPLLLVQDDRVSIQLLEELQASSLIAVPLVSGDVSVGFLVALDRVGADEFDEGDSTLLGALALELGLTLDAYQLFQEVADERERFARIFLGSKEGICLIDADGVVRAWNPTLERLTGYIASEVMGRVWSEIVMMRSKDQKRIEGSALADIDPDEEVELVSRDGPTRWVSVLAGPVQAEGGGWVVLLRDVTAQHEVEQAKSDFLSTISHELRTPLTTIKGSLQVLERNPENLPPDLTRQMIGVTSRGAERLERLVMNLLIVSQIESGTMPLFTDELHLQDIVSERIGIVLREHENVVLKIPDDPLLVRADRERLGQALDHVFDNAMKFGREGTITIAVQRLDGYADVSVSDEGPGIAAVDKERIFDRFVRLGDVLTRETQGAGVGLFIARESMAAMNGEIWVESTPGKGSTFHLKVPMARPIAVARSEAS